MDAADPRSITKALVLMTLLGLSGLAVVPPGEAQIVVSNQDGAYGYGWTFPEGAFPGGEATDDDSDLEYGGDAAVPIGAAPLYKSAELLRVAVDEPDGEVLRFQWEVADLEPHRALAENFFFGVGYTIEFETGGARHRLQSWLAFGCHEDQDPCEPVTDPALMVYSTLYRVTEDSTVAAGRLPTRVLADEGRIELLVPRLALGTHGGKVPRLGDTIGSFQMSATIGFCITSSVETCFEARDQIPDEGTLELHTLTEDANGVVVRIRDPATDARQVENQNFMPWRPRTLEADVDPGDDARFPVTIMNRADRKMIVRPTIEVVSSQDVTIVVPETLEVPARETRRLLVSLKGPLDIDLDDPLLLDLAITAIGTDPVARDALRVAVRPVPSLAPDNPRLYLHTYGDDFIGLSDHGVDTLQWSEGVLNTIEDDPKDHGKGARMHDMCFCLNGFFGGWHSQSSLLRPIHLDNETGGTAHFSLEVPVQGRLDLDLRLYHGEQAVATGSRSVSLDAGDQVVTVPLRIGDDATIVEPADRGFVLQSQAWFRVADVPLGEFVGFLEQANPRLKTQGESWLELPVVDPGAAYAEAAHLLMERAPGVDRVQYVNPGRNLVWNVTVTNQAQEEDRVTFRSDAADGWRTRFAPGTTYRLGPGESVTVGFIATAPGDAKEADTVTFDVQAVSGLGEGAEARLTVAAVVTKSIEIEDGAFVADNETTERLAADPSSKESPFAVWPLLALAVVLGLIRSRQPSPGQVPKPRLKYQTR